MNQNDNTDLPENLHTEPQNIGFAQRALRALQWIPFVVIFLFVVGSVSDLGRTNVPGAPVTLIYASVTAAGLILLLHFPYVFWRLPRLGRPAAYFGMLGFVVLSTITTAKVQSAYERTPQGAEEARLRVELEEEQAAIQAEREKIERSFAEAAATQQQLEEYAAKLEGCFTTFGHRLPALEKAVKESLHNPDAFEHVETVAIVSDADRNNVAMSFRAENGFGAIRTATVRAQVIPDGCAIQSIGEPQMN